jgi:thioester reductase-like protein
MKKVVFLTGATGLIGSNLAVRILKDDPTTQLILLVRGSSEAEAENRLDQLLRISCSEIDFDQARKRITVVRGDITLRRLGLSEQLHARIASEVTHIIHSAATVQFQLPLECARVVNCDGTENVMALAKAAKNGGRLQRAAYISTAYVCGTREGTILEEELDCGQQFANTYERTKFESERLIRQSMNELPLTVFRPSIVVGDSRTGQTTAFNVLYPPLKLIRRHVVDTLPGHPQITLDVVPVDFVSAAINQICLKSDDGVGETYHLTAGEKATTTGEVVDLAVSYFNQVDPKQHTAPVRFLPLESFRAVCGKRVLQALEMYQSYLCTRKTFHNANTLSALAGTDIEPPEFRNYCGAILQFCIHADWGKLSKCAA